MKPTQTPRELLLVCCAICGPLSREEVEKFFSPTIVAQVFKRPMPLLRLSRQPDFPKLKNLFDSSSSLRKLCEAIMMQRSVEQLGFRSPIPDHERCIAAARFALLGGNSIEFLRMHKLYFSMQRIATQLEDGRIEFWNGVLGPEWSGVQFLPAGSVQEEALVLHAQRNMLFGNHGDDRFARLPELLRLGLGALRADENCKPRLSADAAENEPDTDIVIATRAYWNLRAGNWEMTHRCFQRLFRTHGQLLYTVEQMNGAPLMLLAVIVAIRAKATQRVVEHWLTIAREVMLRAVPQSESARRDEIAAFFDALVMWDAIENRSSRFFEIPETPGALASIAIALGARAISQNTGARLPVKELVKNIIAVQERGLKLLAYYAASALAQLPGVKAQELAALTSKGVRKDCDFAPFYEKKKKSVIQKNTVAWEQIESLVNALTPARSRWLFWDLIRDYTGAIVRLEPRLVEERPQLSGVRVELNEVQDASLLNCQDSRDLAVLSLARALEGAQMLRGIPLLAEALVGHPRIRVVEGSYHRPVKVESCLPVIKVCKQEKCIAFELDLKQFYRVIVRSSGAVIAIPAFSARMQALVDYFSHGPVMIDLAHTERLRWFIARLSEYFEFDGELPDELLKVNDADIQFVINAAPYDSGYLLDLDVLHHSSCPEVHDMPGQGERALLLAVKGKAVCVKRDFEAEVAAARRLIAKCPALARAKSSNDDDFQWMMISTADALQAMQEMSEANTPTQWKEGVPALRIVEPLGPLRLKVTTAHADWLEIGAELPVNEKLVFSLSQLLERYSAREGNFLPLGKGRYLHMPPDLAEQVQRLSETLHSDAKEHYRLPMVSLPGFADRWQGAEPLPAAIRERMNLLHSCDAAEPPPGFLATLRDYQLEGYRWLLARACVGFGACLADDMGLGKTIQTLALLLARAGDGASLVITPVSLGSVWIAEAARFAPGLRMITYAELKAAGKTAAPAPGAGDVVVASYNQFTTHPELFSDKVWNVLVLDEAQAIKTPTARRSQLVCELAAATRVCLTGTPLENSAMDLWSIMHFLNPELLGSTADFNRSFRNDLSRLQRLTAPLILRRKKEDVLPQLPPITEVEIGVELNDEERALYEAHRRHAKKQMEAGGSSALLLAELTRLRRLCCHGKLANAEFAGESSKLRVMCQLVENLLEANHSMLIFSQFTDVLDLAQDALEERGIDYLRLDGSTPAAKRSERVRLFQEGATHVFLISLRAGGVGLNLTAADYVVLLDPWWNPAVEAQAASRSHRMGQGKPVTLCRLLTRGTIEERIMQMHDAKLALAESLIREGSMPLETLREIFR